jgi:nucleotide-binding universal stress UspA family protein
MAHTQFLVPLDGSLVAEAALTPAVEFARGPGAKLGLPVTAIVETARYRHADLIVMASHGRSGVSRLVLGSGAESVLRATAVPILLIRPDSAPLDPPFTPVPSAQEVAHV